MVLQILRAFFVLLMAGVGWFFIQHSDKPFGEGTWLALTITVSIAVVFICIDILSPRRKLAIFSGAFLGLIVGLVTSYALSFTVKLMVDQFLHLDQHRNDAIILFVNVVVSVVCCYLAISFIFQSKDDFRFIIPYVEFSKQIRGARPMVVDTSVIIDGRILEVLETGFIDTRLIIPRFILQELQMVADHADRLKRNRGRRGLDVLNKLQSTRKVDVILYDWPGHASDPTTNDEKLLSLSKELGARLLTNDYNLSKVAQVRAIDVVNINDLAAALRPVVLPGEKMQVRLVKQGEEPSQGVGYLEDGTMVVVDHGRAHVNEEVEITITNSLQTATGKMIFGRLAENDGNKPPRRGPEKSQAVG